MPTGNMQRLEMGFDKNKIILNIPVFWFSVIWEHVIWVSGETAHTCAACWAMSGRRFKIDEVPYDHPNGRCQLSPYLPELEEFNPEAYNHDTEAEFNRLTEDEQKNILGKTGFDLWKKGEAKLSDFAQIKDNDIWGRQIGLKSAESLKKKGIKTEKHKENIPVKEKYSEKLTENSKAKKTEKIPEKEEKKTASELTNDNKKSYNISEDKKLTIEPTRVLGSAYQTDFHTVLFILSVLKKYNVSINYNEENNISYGPKFSVSSPTLSINRSDSICSWMHEFQHFLDDKNSGWKFRYFLYDAKEHWKYEYKAYMVEIKYLRKIKRYDIASKLIAFARDEKKRIYDNYGDIEGIEL